MSDFLSDYKRLLRMLIEYELDDIIVLIDETGHDSLSPGDRAMAAVGSVPDPIPGRDCAPAVYTAGHLLLDLNALERADLALPVAYPGAAGDLYMSCVEVCRSDDDADLPLVLLRAAIGRRASGARAEIRRLRDRVAELEMERAVSERSPSPLPARLDSLCGELDELGDATHSEAQQVLYSAAWSHLDDARALVAAVGRLELAEPLK